jgi:GxxExxY protein
VLYQDLIGRGLEVESKKPITFEYKGNWFENAYQADLVVEKSLVVEVKSVPALAPIFENNYLPISGY